jgi:glycosyltransferase involved in cell wall biosynthesis
MERVTAVLVTKNPNIEWLRDTVASLQDQSRPPNRIIVIDASENPPRSVRGVKVVHEPGLGIAEARRRGVRLADRGYVIHLDEDCVLRNPDHIKIGIETLQQEGVSAVGGVVVPIRGNAEGKLVASLSNRTPFDLCTFHLMHHTDICPDGEACFPIELQGRGEDLPLRNRLRESGRIERRNDLVIEKDIPTTRQSGVRNVVVGAVASGIASAVVTAASRTLRSS